MSFLFWYTGLLTSVEDAFILTPRSVGAVLIVPRFWMGALILVAVSLAVAIDVDRFGARRSFPYLGGGFLGLAALSLFASRFISLDVLFAPIALAAGFSAIAIQFKRLRAQDIQLTERLTSASEGLETIKRDASDQRLHSGLKLLDMVLTPHEAVVFRRDDQRRLVASARLRSEAGPIEGGRNSAWREGVNLCERAMLGGDIIVESPEATLPTSIAVPLRHEDQTVGALLVRMNRPFDEEDLDLLKAISGQMARNLQRESAHSAVGSINPLAFFSVDASRKRLESLHVVNGELMERGIGAHALSLVEDGVALAYLDGSIAYANPSLLTRVKVTHEETRSLNFFDLLDRLRTDVFDEPALAVRRVLQTGEPYERELTFPDRNETCRLRIALVFDSPDSSNTGAQPLALALAVKDLTKLKDYEQLKSDMISLMSHELRTPLTSINGFAELLTNEPDLPDQAKEFVGIISSESQRLSRMINTFLAVTNLERKDRQEVLKIPLRLDQVVKETVESLQPIARKKRIRLVEQPTQSLPPVAADKSMISQAVKNLVGNAIKYSPERTTVTVSTALEAEVVRLSVEDRGFGIPSEAKDRVWEKFYRVVREGQEKDDESTGLGLSFVREVIEQHGGAVDLESEVGRGSKFSFTLPRL